MAGTKQHTHMLPHAPRLSHVSSGAAESRAMIISFETCKSLVTYPCYALQMQSRPFFFANQNHVIIAMFHTCMQLKFTGSFAVSPWTLVLYCIA